MAAIVNWLAIVLLLLIKKHIMKTQEVAHKLVTLCREGKNIDAINELYSDDILSFESTGDHKEISGKQAVIEKNNLWFSTVEEMHEAHVSDPVVGGNFFSVSMMYDVTYKEAGRMKMEEIAVYEVKDGKIVFEHFFYSM
jgi:ketosteroid isomerase-like protein